MADSAEPSTLRTKSKLAAPLWHTLGLLIIQLAVSLALLRMRSAGPAAARQHPPNAVLYLSIIVSEWALCFYVWLGGLIPNAAGVRELVGRRWANRKDVLRDLAFAVALWIVATAVAVFMDFASGPSHVESFGFLSPRGAVEVTLWVMMSITAGFCEELVFRGYVQRQFLALTGSVALAVLGQGILFGMAHWYQGAKMMIIITAIGILFGMFAHWRKSLLPGMIAHAWGDIVNLIAICTV
jgi:uncharacterized protein